MHVFWLVSMVLPQAALACGLDSASDVSGGWLTGQLTALQGRKDLQLTVACVDGRRRKALCGTRDDVTYHILPETGALPRLLREARPDLVHLWGTEYAAASALLEAAREQNIPALVGIQGVMQDCAAHLCDGVPEAYRHSTPLDRALDRLIPGAQLDKLQANFNALAQSEAALLGKARHVTGRTAFDRRAVAALAPGAHYYPCNETLRPLFYQGPLWHPRNFGRAPVLLLSQGNYPLKNLHTVLQALPAILERWPDARLRIAGWPPLDKGPLLRPLVDRLFPYQRYCRRLAARLGVSGHIRYTGPLDAAAMRQAYLDADLFLLPSLSENSPNSLGEAMLLGLPCVASAVGGIPDMLTDGVEGRLYGAALDADALARTVTEVLTRPDGGAALGLAARTRALTTHDPTTNAAALWGIYETIVREETP
ncbi:MAG TPA: glycosyltransferase family 4 protein [Candidatus Gemmiger excrementavium]|uniref:Glycosyltransferase family 4 protein n=1 Tax=Candidatus Gemmiger excrementavium TaxID=2838608 RepID=A0A9D2JGU1_9FIRM|nr:glycosyltransferase family 4 protein [Candidatus Gemmiger excrementavium]